MELAVNTSNIRSDNGILTSDHYLSVSFQRCYEIDVVAGTFLNAKKSVGGHAVSYTHLTLPTNREV